ncbi:MAG: hypothetical protein JSU79_05605 [Dehalococcoidales bacterium]|nr:MAG: hypothetical protein JSU79_05605 [Dehalococcoidales bacterium]
MGTVYSFGELTPDLYRPAGGKGRVLSLLFQKKFPVPEGFIILPGSFNSDDITEEAWERVLTHLKRIRRGNQEESFSVRSSAIAEDSALASFAGEFETVLDVSSDIDIKEAIRRVRLSRHSQRVKEYSRSMGVEAVHEMAVIIQRMIQPEISGVLFTADPLTGDRTRMIGNYVYGTGDKLVSGESNAAEFTLQWAKGKYEGPAELKRYHRKLHKLARRLEKELGCPQDVEWAVSGNKLYILQSRSISTMIGYNPVTGECNDSLTGDYVWSCGNYAEAAPEVMTPLTWSVQQLMADENVSMPGCIWMGNIGGHLYNNISLSVYVYSMYKMNRRLEKFSGEFIGEEALSDARISSYLAPIPSVGFISAWIHGMRIRYRWITRGAKTQIFIRNNPTRCREMVERIRNVEDKQELAALLIDEIYPFMRLSFSILMAAAERFALHMGSFRIEMNNFIGKEETNRLLTCITQPEETLASLGPVTGLAEVASGQIGREEYLEKWGHRIAGELELSIPRPFEDPSWLDRRLEEFNESPYDINELRAKRRREFDLVWEKIRNRYPGKAKSIRKKVDRVTEDSRRREDTRSEITRAAYITRLWCLQAGKLTGIGNDIFFLSIDEIHSLLSGKEVHTEYIPARKSTYEKYKKLPHYPRVICGRFDPFKWTEDPNRNVDIYDSHKSFSENNEKTVNGNIISGIPGSAGIAEGFVRILDNPEEGSILEKGEILVASTTNIGWTLIFPRAGAIVTDIGAPLSHAAVVSRELGIPAVVNCGDATMRLKTGDRVRVDGARGTVEILD